MLLTERNRNTGLTSCKQISNAEEFASFGVSQWVRLARSSVKVQQQLLLVSRHSSGGSSGCWNVAGGDFWERAFCLHVYEQQWEAAERLQAILALGVF